ncbi:MAG: CHAT domain-containing protein [Planctomycetes bacterium]|nr:CHAT domain-containing protein [Planctomycetota bacterium]
MTLAPFLLALPWISAQAPPLHVALDVVARGRLDAEGGSASAAPCARFEFTAPDAGRLSVAVCSHDFDPALRIVGGAHDGKPILDGGFEGDVWSTVEFAATERVVLEVLASDARGGEFEIVVAKELAPPRSRPDARAAWRTHLRVSAERAVARGELGRALELATTAARDLSERGPLGEACAAWKRVEELAEKAGRQDAVRHARVSSACARLLLGEDQEALAELERVERDAAEAPPAERGAILRAFGQALYQSGETARARTKLEAACPLLASANAAREECLARCALAVCLASSSDADAAAIDQELARADVLAREAASNDLRVEAWFARGLARLNQGHALEAEDALERALEYDPAPLRRIDLLATSAQALVELQRPFDARERFGASLALARELGASGLAPEYLLSFADLEMTFGELDLSIDLLESAAAELAGEGRALRRAEVLTTLGQARLFRAEAAHDAAAARKDREGASAAAREVLATGKARGELRLQVNGAILGCGASGKYTAASTEARRALDEVAAAMAERGELALDGLASGQRAWDDFLLGRDAEAVRGAEHAYAAFSLFDENEPCLTALETIALAALHARDVERLASALDRAELRLDRDALRRGSAQEIAELRSAFASFEELAHDLVALRLGAASPAAGEHELAKARGFEAAGAWKARSLVETLVRHRRTGPLADDDRSKDARAERLAERTELEGRARAQAAPDAIAAALHAADAARKRVEECERAAWKRSVERDPSLAARGQPPTAVRTALAGKRAWLVEYVAGTEDLYAYVLTDARLEFVHLGPRAAIEADAARFVRAASAEGGGGGFQELVDLGRTLHARLLRPVLDRMGGEPSELVIVPTAALASLPFEALIVEAPRTEAPARRFADLAFLLRRCAVSYAPSAPVLAELAATRPSTRPRTALVCADPRYEIEPTGRTTLAGSPREALPGEPELALERLGETRKEAARIASLLASSTTPARPEDALAILAIERGELDHMRSVDGFELLLGKAASTERFTALAPSYRVLHLAMHGLGPRDGRGPALAFASTESHADRLACEDILALRLDADLVVLAACETATGRTIDGEGVQSIASAFLHAGARSVVATQWRVRDLQSSALMQSFYGYYLKQGLPPAQALRKAKLEFLAGDGGRGEHVVDRSAPGRLEDPADPYFWAAFVYSGLPE